MFSFKTLNIAAISFSNTTFTKHFEKISYMSFIFEHKNLKSLFYDALSCRVVRITGLTF